MGAIESAAVVVGIGVNLGHFEVPMMELDPLLDDLAVFDLNDDDFEAGNFTVDAEGGLGHGKFLFS